MKPLKYILLFMAAGLLAGACVKPDDEGYVHDECAIRAMVLKSNVNGSAELINGVFEAEETDAAGNPLPVKVNFKIPYPKWDYYDLEHARLRATVTYDEVLEPSLDRSFDLSESYEDDKRLIVTVRNTVTGAQKQYSIMAYKSTDL